jgi:hypothetical protein
VSRLAASAVLSSDLFDFDEIESQAAVAAAEAQVVPPAPALNGYRGPGDDGVECTGNSDQSWAGEPSITHSPDAAKDAALAAAQADAAALRAELSVLQSQLSAVTAGAVQQQSGQQGGSSPEGGCCAVQ